MIVTLPYGKKSVRISIPKERLLGILDNSSSATKSPKKLLELSLAKPQVSSALKDALGGAKSVLIVVPDNTRKAHLAQILPHFLKKIDDGTRRIEIIVATGLHTKLSPSELDAMLGGAITRDYRVLAHEASGSNIVFLGRSKRGAPMTIDKRALEYDVLISFGVVEPHLYAGYSGGAKTVAIGLTGEETIDVTHGISFLDHPGTRLGSIDDNPFQETLWEIVRHVPLAFSVNVVSGPDGGLIAIYSGQTRAAFTDAVRFAKKIFEVKVKKSADIVICAIGSPKDVNLYQASRAINYILNVDRPILRKGGLLIVVAQLRDGIGRSGAEKRFYDSLKGMRSPAEFISNVKSGGCSAGAHRAYMVAKPLLEYRVAFVTAGKNTFMTALSLPTFKSVYDALAYADGTGKLSPTIYVVPHALATIASLR